MAVWPRFNNFDQYTVQNILLRMVKIKYMEYYIFNTPLLSGLNCGQSLLTTQRSGEGRKEFERATLLF